MKVNTFLQRFKPSAIANPLEPIVTVVNGSPFSIIVRKYHVTHRAEGPIIDRDTMNDRKSPPANGLTSEADGGPRTLCKIYNTN